MKAKIYKGVRLIDMVDELKEELDAQGVQHHIAFVNKPEPPFCRYAMIAAGSWLDFLEALEDFFPVICFYRYHEGVLYAAILIDQNWSDKEDADEEDEGE